MGYEINLGNGEWATGQGGMAMTVTDTDTGVKEALLMGCDRNAVKTEVDKNNVLVDVLSYQPSVTYINGVGVLNTEPQSENLESTSDSGTYGSAPSSESFSESPTGDNTAIVPVPSSNSNRYQYTFQGGVYPTNQKITYSWYRKRLSTPTGAVEIGDLNFDGQTNLTVIAQEQIESNINGFDRFKTVFNITDGSVSSVIRAYFGIVVETGNSSVAYWGHQLELMEEATSLMRTNGATYTRLADTGFKTPDISKWLDSDDFVLSLNLKTLNTSTERRISLNANSNSNRIEVTWKTNTTLNLVLSASGVLEANDDITITDSDVFKTYYVIKNGLTISIKQGEENDGIDEATEVYSRTFASINFSEPISELSFNSLTNDRYFYGHTKTLKLES